MTWARQLRVAVALSLVVGVLGAQVAVAQTSVPVPPPSSAATATSPTTTATPPTTGAKPTLGTPPTSTLIPPKTTASPPAPVPATPGVPLTSAEIVTTLGRLAALDAATLVLSDAITAQQGELSTRRAELAAAAAAAEQAAAVADGRRTQADQARAGVDGLVLAAYSGARTFRLSALLLARSPQELLDRMTVLELLQQDSTRALSAARDGVVVADTARGAADDAQAVATAAEGQTVAAQAVVVGQRTQLQEQTAQATALLSTLLAQDVGGVDPALLARLALSTAADARRASRTAAQSLAFVVVPAEGQFTSGFGLRDGVPHKGIDIANRIGTPIVAAADGVVIDAGPATGFGLWVRVRHGDGTVSTYGHVDRFVVRVGQQVTAGELIALMGNRGESTGPHLHFEITPPGGTQVDPRAWLAERGVLL